MRKLKLQVQMTADGFIAGPEGQLDWMMGDSEDRNAYVNALTDSCDTILMGRKMAGPFMEYWESVTPDEPETYPFARKMVEYHKVIFSRTITSIEGENARVETAPLATAVNGLKSASGKDIIVYGGAELNRSLLAEGLIDELHLFIHPAAIGEGLRIFDGPTPLELVASNAFTSGVVCNHYRPG